MQRHRREQTRTAIGRCMQEPQADHHGRKTAAPSATESNYVYQDISLVYASGNTFDASGKIQFSCGRIVGRPPETRGCWCAEGIPPAPVPAKQANKGDGTS